MSFLVGNVRIDPPCVLAPMEGITDRDFRGLIRGLGGCGLTVTEFVSSEAMTRNVSKAWKMAELDPDERGIYATDPFNIDSDALARRRGRRRSPRPRPGDRARAQRPPRDAGVRGGPHGLANSAPETRFT